MSGGSRGRSAASCVDELLIGLGRRTIKRADDVLPAQDRGCRSQAAPPARSHQGEAEERVRRTRSPVGGNTSPTSISPDSACDDARASPSCRTIFKSGLRRVTADYRGSSLLDERVALSRCGGCDGRIATDQRCRRLEREQAAVRDRRTWCRIR